MLAALLTLLIQPPAPAPAADDPTVVRANLRLKDVDLGELVAKANVNLPVKLSGKISVDVAAEIPLTEARTLKAYKVRGKATVPALAVGDFAFRDVAADIDFSNGVLTLTELSAKVPDPARPAAPGLIRGSAKFGVDPRGDLSADLKLTDVPVGEVLKAHPDLAGLAAGPLSGALDFRLPADKLNSLAAAVADGHLASPGLTAAGRKLGPTRLDLKLRDGVARVTDATSTVEGLPVRGSASVTLSGKYPFEATVTTRPTEVADLAKLAGPGALPVDVRGKVELTAAATGTLSPLAYSLGGKAAAAELVVGTARLDKVSFDYKLTEAALTLSDLKAEAFGGTAAGGGTVPLRETDPGEFSVTLTDLDASALTKAVPSLPLKLDGRVGGTVSGTLPPAEAGKPRAATVAVDVQAPRLRVQGVPTSRLRGKVDYAPGALVYKLTGESLGGTFDLDGTYPLAAKPGDAPGGGAFRLNRVQLRRLAEALDAPGLAPLRGRLYVAVRYRYDAAGRGPFGEGEVRINDFGWSELGGTRDRSDLVAPVRVTPEAIDLPDLAGQLAGGVLRGRVRYNLARPDRSYYNLTLDKANADRLLAPFGAGDGFGRATKLSVQVRGTLGRELRGTGSVTASRAAVAGTDLSDLRVPFEYAVAPGAGGQVTVRDLNAQAAGGRVTGQAVYRWGAASTLEGGFRFVGVSLRQLLGISVGITAGRFNGRFDFAGRDAKTVNDITGVLSGSFNDPNPFDAPVLRQLQPFLNPRQILTPLSEGDVRARLAGGVFRVERFTLSGNNLRVYADGTLALNGRIDLDFKAQTGQVAGGAGALALFGIPAVGPIPIGAVIRASQFLSNRSVLLKVTGTVDNPTVQVNVAALLADEAIRYFLGGINPLAFRP